MNDRKHVLNSIISSEAILASFVGLFIIVRPVVQRSMLRL